MIGELDRKTWEPKKMIMTGHLKRQIARDLRIKPSTDGKSEESDE